MRLMFAAGLLLIAQGAIAAPTQAETGENAARPASSVTAAFASVQAGQQQTSGQLLSLNWSLKSGQETAVQQSGGQQAGEQHPSLPPASGDGASSTDELESGASLDDPSQGSSAQSSEDEGNEIVVEGEYGPPRNDPVEALNFESYRITQAVDDAFVEPVAYAYRDGLPTPIRDGLGNVVRNLGEPVNALNFLLQGKFGKALGSLTRLLINSTLGLGGVFDMAEKPGIGIPYRRNGFANTLGFYGVEPGAYLYLPFTGATSVRDLIGSGIDQLVLPVAVGAPFNTPEYALPYFVVNSLDARLDVDAELARIDQTVDPYAARRDTYLARREREIALLRGEEPPKPPLILLEVEGVIEPGDDYPEEFEDGDGEGDGAQESQTPPLSLNFERGEVMAGQIR